MTTLGDYIARKREEKGLTQRDLAKKAGFSHGTLNKIENGLTSHPGIDVLMGISKALNVPITSIIAAYQGREPEGLTSSAKEEVVSDLLEALLKTIPAENIFAAMKAKYSSTEWEEVKKEAL